MGKCPICGSSLPRAPRGTRSIYDWNPNYTPLGAEPRKNKTKEKCCCKARKAKRRKAKAHKAKARKPKAHKAKARKHKAPEANSPLSSPGIYATIPGFVPGSFSNVNCAQFWENNYNFWSSVP